MLSLLLKQIRDYRKTNMTDVTDNICVVFYTDYYQDKRVIDVIEISSAAYTDSKTRYGFTKAGQVANNIKTYIAQILTKHPTMNGYSIESMNKSTYEGD